MKISEVLAKYDTDKVREHSYGPAYDKLFESFDIDATLEILEIGTQKGGSLCAWKEYFPNSKVTGVDIVDVVKPDYRKSDIEYVFSDIKEWQTDKQFDIVIDDGSHFLEDVLYVIKTYYPKLKPGGLMVIEDVQHWTWLNKIDVPFSIHDLRHVKGNYDDFLIVIKK